MKQLQIKFEKNHRMVLWRDLQSLQGETFKKITKTNMAKLKNSIRNNGFIQPLVVWQASDGKLWLLDGYHRVLALKELDKEFKSNSSTGIEIPDQLPAIFVEADSIQEAAKRVPLMSSQYATVQEAGMLNFAHSYGIDLELLKEEVSIPDLSLGNLVSDFVWRDEPFVKSELKEGIDVRTIPPLFQKGVFMLGEHLIYAGDSEKEENYSYMLKTCPNVCITDPPYGVSYNPKWRQVARSIKPVGNQVENTVANDDRADWSSVWKLFTGNTILSFYGIQKHIEVIKSFESSGFKLVHVLIWVKSNFALSRHNYHRQYEPIMFANRVGKPIAWTNNLDQSDVFQFPTPNNFGGDSYQDSVHSTQKPVELITKLILNHTYQNEWVYDPFLGSGTTVIACENTGRRCVGGDIEPAHVETAIVRWATHIGLENARQVFKVVQCDTPITLDDILKNRTREANGVR